MANQTQTIEPVFRLSKNSMSANLAMSLLTDRWSPPKKHHRTMGLVSQAISLVIKKEKNRLCDLKHVLFIANQWTHKVNLFNNVICKQSNSVTIELLETNRARGEIP